MVKANGYGHGALEAARAAQAGGASWIAVATAAEAAALRAAGVEGTLLVMGALTRDEAAAALESSAEVAAWSEAFLSELAALGAGFARRPRVHVKLDTGMGRLGTGDRAEARRVAATAAGDDRLELAGVMTHFATADELGDDHFPAQLAAFT